MTAEAVEVARRRARARRMRSPEGLKRLVVTAGLTVAAVYFLLPAVWLAIAATKDTSALFGSFGLALVDPRPLANLRDLFTFSDGIYLRWTLNSVLYAGGGALAATLLAAAAGYALAKYRFRGRETLFNLVLGGVLVPATVLGLPLYMMVSKVGLANTYWAVLLPSMVSPFGVYLSRIYADAAVPDDLIAAARVDGAGEWQLFWYVIFPLLHPITLTAVIILGHISLKIFDLTVSMTGPGPGFATDVPALFMYETTFFGSRFSQGAAIAVVLLLLVGGLIVPYLVYNARNEVQR